jgi:hypothetical protein
VAACGDDDDASSDEPATESEAAGAAVGLDPAEVEASVQEFLDADEVAAALSPTVDCGDEAGETLDCAVAGDKGLEGTVSAAPSQGFQYTGEIEGPDGPSSVGGSVPEGSLADPAGIERALDEALADDAGKPTADCADAPEGDSLECEVTGEGVSGALTVTPIGGFEWEGQIATPEGTRAIAGNALP